MTNAELIKALRICATQICCDNCPRLDGYPDEESSVCATNLLSDAADAIERLIAEIDRKDKALQAWAKTWENAKGKLIENICQHCDSTPDERLVYKYCDGCPITEEIREVFDGVSTDVRGKGDPGTSDVCD